MRDALGLINQVLDEVLAAQENDFDSDSRWALAWFEQAGFSEAEYGLAEILSKAKNTSVDGLRDGKILVAKAGRVRLLRPNESSADWDPTHDRRLTVWEIVQHLIRALESGGETAAAELVRSLATGPRSPENWHIGYTRFVKRKSGHQRHFPTTHLCKAGRKSHAWLEKVARRKHRPS